MAKNHPHVLGLAPREVAGRTPRTSLGIAVVVAIRCPAGSGQRVASRQSSSACSSIRCSLSSS
jgi:hypothetical protein